MLYFIILKVAIKSICANKLRTILAMLGIIIGTGSVVSMLALGNGARMQVLKNVNKMGTNLLSIHPMGRHRAGVRTQNLQRLTLKDAESILNEVNNVEMVAPVVQGSAQIKYFENNYPSTVYGTSNTYFSIRNCELSKGRVFNDEDAANSSHVAILGEELKSNLFQNYQPIGETIKINGINFKVIGILKSKGDQGRNSPDEAVFIPYTTAMKNVFGLKDIREIIVMGKEGSDLTAVENNIESLLKQRHNISPGKDNDFRIFNQAELIETASKMTETFSILLGSIASISLIVGGIGIMNIMLVTVSERTREIGVRIAIGARRIDILIQFLLESILICTIGGILGILLGVGTAGMIAYCTNFKTAVQLWSILLSLLVSISVGTFFGYYPARKAAFLNPIDALRHE